ncbi:MAG TPA: hypothetical protein VFA33_15785 [Bryobacteraceae bacterium]|nr:hypothetical protein [Bryobacteraceae bacterium]
MKLAAWLLIACACHAAESYPYWIAPCTSQLARESGCESGDPELAEWALAAWQRASQGSLAVTKSASEEGARIRIYWVPGNQRLYGETHPLLVNGKPGAAIHVRPDLAQLGPDIEATGRKDPLFRHVVVYLTCLHESGHAFGLPHTAQFDDIMYSFAYGGDIVEYFMRYRRRVESRNQIRQHSGISASDQQRLAALFSLPHR